MGKFKEYMLEENSLIDALTHGVKTGIKAFKEKRVEQKAADAPKTITKQILSAEGKELEAIIKKIVDNGYTISHGKVQKESPNRRANDWLLEHVPPQIKRDAKKVGEVRLAGSLLS